MKSKFIIALVMILICCSLTGCANSNFEDESNKPELNIEPTAQTKTSATAKPSEDVSGNTVSATPSSAPVEIANDTQVDSENLKIILPLQPWNKMTKEGIQEWVEYINDKYDSTIEVVTVQENFDMNSNETIRALKEVSAGGGFIYVDDVNLLSGLRESGMIVPVNEYMGRIDKYNTLSDIVIKTLSDPAGDMWGLPLSDEPMDENLNRFYDSEWLEAAGMGVPQTVDEFFEFAMFVSQNDLDGNGKNDSYVAQYSDYSWLFEFEDILRAFGCYSYHQCPIAYNPVKGIYEDSVLTEGFKEAMAYIKILYDAGVIYKEANPGNDTSLDTYRIASCSGANYFENMGGDIEISRYLTGVNDEKLCRVRYTGACFAVLNGTSEPDRKMNEFLSMLMSDPNSKMDFFFGIEGTHYTDEGDHYNYKTKDASGKTGITRVNISVRLSDMGFSDKYTFRDGIDYRAENAEFYDKIERATDGASEIAKEMKFSLHLDINDSRIDDIRSKTYSQVRGLFNNIMVLNKDIDEAINIYKTQLQTLGVPDLIDKMNMGLDDN